MANIIFTKGVETFTFSKGREYPVHDPVNVNVVTDYSEGGKAYCYDKGIAEQFFHICFRNLPQADYDNYEDWLENIAVGPKNTFTYTDEDSVAHTVRLMDKENPLQRSSHNSYDGTISLRKEI